MKKRTALAASILVLITLFSVPTTADDKAGDMDIPTRREAAWTIMSYMNGDNNLEKDLLDDLNEMERVPDDPMVNIVVQLDRVEGYDSRFGDWTDTRRFMVVHDTGPDLASVRVDDPPLGEVEMDDPESLRDFILWGVASYPADHYMLIIEGHADGPVAGLLMDETSSRPGSNRMTLPEMGSHLRDAVDTSLDEPLDIISLDVCWMGMAEAAAELMDHADHMIGAFDETPAAGLPYDMALPEVIDPENDMQEKVSGIIDAFADHYDLENLHSYASLVAVDLREFKDTFMPWWEQLAREMFYTAYDSRDAYDSAVAGVDKPNRKGDDNYDRFVDAYQLAQVLHRQTGVPDRTKWAAAGLLDGEDQVIIRREGGTNHPPGSRLFGIYLPSEWNDLDYSKTHMGKSTAWDDYIQRSVRDLDVNAIRLNWTSEVPSNLRVSLSTSTPEMISSARVEILLGDETTNVSMAGSGGFFTGWISPVPSNSFNYRYRIEYAFGGYVDLPPDGYLEWRSGSDGDPPEVWHFAPSVVDYGVGKGGLRFLIRDPSGISTSPPDKAPRLEYKEAGTDLWYSTPLSVLGSDTIRGYVEYWASPAGMDPGAHIQYRVICEDVHSNNGTYPAEGVWTSVMGVGDTFLLDGAHSTIDDYTLLSQRFMELGMAVEIMTTPPTEEDMNAYKGVIIVEPMSEIGTEYSEDIRDLLEEGMELLLVMDPSDPLQVVASRELTEILNIEPTENGDVNGFFPRNPDSDLGDTLPSVVGSSEGSFVLDGDDHASAAYYSVPPLASMYSTWNGKGKIVVSIPELLDDAVMDRGSNMMLADIVISYLHENMVPELDLDVYPDRVLLPGEGVNFDLSGSSDMDGDILSYYMTSSDNTHREGPGPVIEHTFENVGVYTVELGIVDEDSGVSQKTITIRVSRPPSTDHGISSLLVHAGDIVNFDYKGEDPDGDPITIKWDFGDGFAKTGETVTHSYMERGEYTYRITVWDIWGLELNRTGTITVENSDPQAVMDRESIMVNSAPANFSGQLKVTLRIAEGDTVRISGAPSFDPDRSDVVNLSWDMGDGTVLYGEMVSHRFLISGLLTVNLTADDGHGGVSHETLKVSVENRAPVAVFDYEDNGGGNLVFDATDSTDDPWDTEGLIYSWDFGDGKTLETEEPVVEHEYRFSGEYDVKLTVIDADGALDIMEKEVEASGINKVVIYVFIGAVVVVGLVAAGVFVHRRSRRKADSKEVEVDDTTVDRGREFSKPIPLESIEGRRKGSRKGRSYDGEIRIDDPKERIRR